MDEELPSSFSVSYLDSAGFVFDVLKLWQGKMGSSRHNMSSVRSSDKTRLLK